MRICVVAGTFHPEAGGPPTALYHLLPELVRLGHSLEVITYTDGPRSGFDDDNYPYPVFRVTRRQSIPARLIGFTRQVLRAGRSADVIFVSDYGLPAALANLALRKPLVLKIVSDFAWEFSLRHNWIPATVGVEQFQAFQPAARVRLLRRVQAAYVRRATRVIAPSQHVAGLVAGWGAPPERVKVIYNAIRFDQFRDLPPRATLRAELGWGDQPVLITVARLTPVKGIDLVLQGLAAVRDHLPARLVIVGDGPGGTELDALAARLNLTAAVEFAGRQMAETVARYLRAADVCVLGSRTEGLPHVALEALAAGTPVVATRVGGTPEVIADERTGLLTAPNSPAALASAVERLLRDPALGKRLVSAGQEELERFSWPRLVSETNAVLSTAAASRKVPA